MPLESRQLLIIACSQRKTSHQGYIPALDRYDGGSYRTIRKAKREGYFPKNLDMLILSAKYGLIESNLPIADYEQRMTPARAEELETPVTQTLKSYEQGEHYGEVYVDLGGDYSKAVREIEHVFRNAKVTWAEGRIGQRLASLKTWLVANSKGKQI